MQFLVSWYIWCCNTIYVESYRYLFQIPVFLFDIFNVATMWSKCKMLPREEFCSSWWKNNDQSENFYGYIFIRTHFIHTLCSNINLVYDFNGVSVIRLSGNRVDHIVRPLSFAMSVVSYVLSPKVAFFIWYLYIPLSWKSMTISMNFPMLKIFDFHSSICPLSVEWPISRWVSWPWGSENEKKM